MATDNIVIQFVATTPPITRILVALTVATSVSTFLGFVKPQQLSYSRFYLWECQFYRALTTFFYYGKTNFELIMNFIFLYKYSSMLEESYAKKSDYFFVLLIVFVLLFATSNVVYIPFLATAFSNTITYIWARKNPQGIVQIFGFVSFNAFYLPFIFPMVSLVFEGRVSKDEVLGIVVGQIVFYFKDVYPRFGRDFLKTPCWCHKLLDERCPCCESGPIPRRKVSDFAKSKHQRAVEEAPTAQDNDESCSVDNDSNWDNQSDIQDNGGAQYGALGSGNSEDEPEEKQEKTDVVTSVDESSTKNDECLDDGDSEHENWEPEDPELDDSSQHLSDSLESGNEIDQNDEESFNSEEVCNEYNNISDAEGTSHDMDDFKKLGSHQDTNPSHASACCEDPDSSWGSE